MSVRHVAKEKPAPNPDKRQTFFSFLLNKFLQIVIGIDAELVFPYSFIENNLFFSSIEAISNILFNIILFA